MTVAEALAGASIDPREARLLLGDALGLNAAQLIARPGTRVTEPAATRFLDRVRRRAAGEPIAYLTGRRAFHALELEVTPAVLIPRPETELLVDLALERIGVDASLRVADLGTGSGAIALAIRQARPMAVVTGIDASAAALAVARRNATRLALAVEWREGSWLEGIASAAFDLIVSNPPYVRRDDPHLAQGDLRFEPRVALDGGADGLDALRAIVASASRCLARGGWLLVEHGHDQATAVRALFETAGYDVVTGWNDLAGIARVCGGRVR